MNTQDRKPPLPRNKKLRPFSTMLRNNPTRQENRLWYEYLRLFRPRFYRQRIIGGYIADFYCAKAKLVVELDGSGQYTEEGKSYDACRTEYFNALGLYVLRFTNSDVDKNLRGVCEVIGKVVSERVVRD